MHGNNRKIVDTVDLYYFMKTCLGNYKQDIQLHFKLPTAV